LEDLICKIKDLSRSYKNFQALKIILRIGDFDKNNLFLKEKHKMTLWPNHFTGLTLLCGALAIGVTLHYVAPCKRRHTSMLTWRGRRCAPLTGRRGRMCGAVPMGATI
jgi:hypothetical protein